MSKVDQTLKYDPEQMTNSSYSLLKVVPLSGNQQVIMAAADGPKDIMFEIPNQAFNFARSYFSCDVSIPLTDANATFYHDGILPFESLQIYTRGGMYLLNLSQNLAEYCKVVVKADSTRNELIQGSGDGILSSSHKAATLYNNDAVGSVVFPYVESRNFRNSAVAGALTFQLNIPLSVLKDTICAVDKSILLREVLVVKARFATVAKMSFLALSVTDLSADISNAAGSITYDNITLYVAQERNAQVVESLNNQTSTQEGFSLLIPYPSTFYNAKNAAATQNVSIRMDRSHGQVVKEIKHAVFAANTTNNRLFDRNNTAQIKMVSYYTNINNNRLTEYNIECAKNLDVMANDFKLKNSATLNSIDYKQNWVHCDNFIDANDKMSDLTTKDTNAYGGISLDSEVRWDFYGSTATVALNHLTIVHGVKVLNVNQSGIVLG